MGHGVGRAARDPGFELLEIIGDGGFFLAGTQVADGFDVEREPAAGRCVQKTRKTGVPVSTASSVQMASRRWGRPSSGRGRCWARTRGCRRSGRSPGRRAGRTGPEDALDGHGRRQVAAQEQFGLRMRAPVIEPAIELARDVSGPLHQQSKGNAAAKQPVDARDMSPQVAADQDRAAAIGRGGARRS